MKKIFNTKQYQLHRTCNKAIFKYARLNTGNSENPLCQCPAK